MATVEDYKLIRARIQEDNAAAFRVLEGEVLTYLQSGWSIHGVVLVVDGWIVQPMIRCQFN